MTSDLHLGREILGVYRIVRRIAEGGMASVYLADDRSERRSVAVKILSRAFSTRPDIVSRFRREARALSRLSHPNTVRVFLYGQLEDGALYMVMEYVEGKSLQHLLRTEGPFDPARAVRVVVQVCGALGEAHRAGLVHRDVKPENLLVVRRGGVEHVKLIDFGLARVTEREIRRGSVPNLTNAGAVFGTPQFMSPEQAEGHPLDARSDLYSLGVILYELVTGRLPFDVEVPIDYINAHVDDPPIPLALRRPGRAFPPGLQEVLDRVLAKRPADRYASAAELASALESLVPD